MNSVPIAQISPQELFQRLQTEDHSLQLIDVRELAEVAIAAIEGFQIFPLSAYGEWCDQITTQLDPHQETIVLCHHGIRSAQMCAWLQHQGFTQVKNLSGGIDAYACAVDPELSRY